MKRIGMLALLFALLPVPSAAPAAEPVVVTRFDIDTGIGETKLANGLTILTHERHSAPVVSCHIWYRVGSADEESGETGLAHFLEHMMFKGTNRYARGEIDRITLKLGGSNNAGTSRDYTYYYFNLAADRWETAIEIEANRMRNLTLDKAQFEAEKKVVIEELQMGRDNPWGEIDETQEATAFLSHPYRHPIVGWRSDVEGVTHARMKAFYDRHYHPRNATIVLVGDFDTKRAVARISELFGKIPAGPERERTWTKELPQRGERRIAIRRDAEVGRVQVLYHGMALADPDSHVNDVIAQILGGSKSSRLNRRLVEDEQIATFVSVSDDSRRRDPGLFWIWSETKVGADPEVILASTLEELEKLKEAPVSEDELNRAKRSLVTAQVFSRTTADETAQLIGWFATVADWRIFGKQRELVESVTAEDVQRVAPEAFFDADRRTVAIQPPGTGGGGADKAETGNRSPRRSRGGAPAVATGSVAVRISPTVVKLENGLTLLLLQHTASPVTALRIRVDAGVLREAKPGLSNLTGNYLLEGSAGRDGIEISKEAERIGAALSVSTGSLSGACLSADTEELVRIATDIVLRPDFPEEDLKKLREAAISSIRAERDDPQSWANREFAKLVFGDHPRARPDQGTEEGVASLTREDVLAHYRTRYVPQKTMIAAVSDRPVEELQEILVAAFGEWSGKTPTDPVLPAMPADEERRLHFDREIDQANVYIGHRGVARRHPDYYSLRVMDYVLGLGPGFTDRLSRNIRDRDGLAYDVHASITNMAGITPGAFYAYVGTSADQRNRAIKAIVGEVRRIREEKVTEEELADAKAYLTGSFVFGYETAEQVARNMMNLRVYGLTFDFPAEYADLINAVTAEDVLRVARKHLHPEKLTIVTVGPGRE